MCVFVRTVGLRLRVSVPHVHTLIKNTHDVSAAHIVRVCFKYGNAMSNMMHIL